MPRAIRMIFDLLGLVQSPGNQWHRNRTFLQHRLEMPRVLKSRLFTHNKTSVTSIDHDAVQGRTCLPKPPHPLLHNLVLRQMTSSSYCDPIVLINQLAYGSLRQHQLLRQLGYFKSVLLTLLSQIQRNLYHYLDELPVHTLNSFLFILYSIGSASLSLAFLTTLSTCLVPPLRQNTAQTCKLTHQGSQVRPAIRSLLRHLRLPLQPAVLSHPAERRTCLCNPAI